MPSPSRRDLSLLGLGLLAVVVFTSPRFLNGFVWDDQQVIVEGEVIHDPSKIVDVFAHRTLYVSAGFEATDDDVGVDTYRPVTLVTFFVDAAIGGRSPIPYHVTNLLLHLAAMVLVFFVARRLLSPERRHIAPLSAAWFGLTPHLAEAHVWIDGRSDLLVTIFGLAALLAHRRAAASEGRRALGLAALAAALFFFGLLSKEVLLLALPAYALFPHEADAGTDTPGLRRRVVAAIPLAIAAVAYLALRVWVLSGVRAVRNEQQLLAALVRLPVMLLDGFVELVVPSRVYVHSMYEDYRALGLTLVLVLGGCALVVLGRVWARRERAPALAWSLFFFACTLAPAAVIATINWPGFGRYLYLPFAGLVGGLTEGLGRGYEALRSRRPAVARIARVFVPAYLAFLGLRLALYTTDYRDDRALWSAVIAAAPDRAHGHGYYGMTLLEEGDARAAIAPLTRAVALDPGEPRYLAQLGWAHLDVGDRQAALDVAATGIARHVPSGRFHAIAARALDHVRPDLATEHAEACLAIEPRRPECLEAARILGIVSR